LDDVRENVKQLIQPDKHLIKESGSGADPKELVACKKRKTKKMKTQ